MLLKEKYWTDRYNMGQTQWDIGYVSTPVKEYVDKLIDKSIKILIPGCGNAYEAQYLFNLGFSNVFIIDISERPIRNFLKSNPSFPEAQAIVGDFFDHRGRYDLIIEQTFFCSIQVSDRDKYVGKMKDLLNIGGKLVGVLFNVRLNENHPPFGGNKMEYHRLFSSYFSSIKIERCYNSIKPRLDREVFIIIEN